MIVRRVISLRVSSCTTFTCSVSRLYREDGLEKILGDAYRSSVSRDLWHDAWQAPAIRPALLERIAGATARAVLVIYVVGYLVALPNNLSQSFQLLLVAQSLVLGALLALSFPQLPLSGASRLSAISFVIFISSMMAHWRNGEVLIAHFNIFVVSAVLVAIFRAGLALSISALMFLVLWLQGVYMGVQPLSELTIHSSVSFSAALVMALFFKVMISQSYRDNDQIQELLDHQKRLLSVVSRELRVPAMALSVLTMKENLGDDDRVNMRDAAEQLLLVIDNLRATHEQAEGRPISNETFQLSMLAQQLRAQMAPVFQNLGFELFTDIHPSAEGFFIGDKFRLRTILSNLLRNSAYYSDGHRLWLTVKAENTVRRDVLRVVAEVEDNGHGLSQELVERLMRKAGKHSVTPGVTGLGLWVAQDWIEQLGGKLEHTSSARGGSKFRLELELKVDTGKEYQDDNQGVNVGTPWEEVRVLLADGDAALRRTFSELLVQNGAYVQEAASSAHIIDILEMNATDLLLLDDNLPGMAVEKLVELLRTNQNTVPIIAITGDTIKQLQHRLLAVGADVVIRKPVRESDLNAAINTLVTMGRMRRGQHH